MFDNVSIIEFCLAPSLINMSFQNIVRKTHIRTCQRFIQRLGIINTLVSVTTMATATFPKSLKEFGYDFDEDGRLRKLSKTGLLTKEGFEFNVSEDPQYNQKRYEALGEVINEYVYNLLEKEGLNRLPLPKKTYASVEKKSFIFASNDALENEKVIVLIHGSGVVRAGQWARRLIINDSLYTGTQISYVRKAKDLGYGLFVLNTNDNFRIKDGRLLKIKGSEDPHEHLHTAWKDYIEPSNSKYVAVVAHSYGGECITKFAVDHPKEFKEKVFAVGLTDSVHVAPPREFEHVIKVSRNWVCSDKPLDAPVLCPSGDIERVSAGHTVHEMSSSSCIDSLFRFIEERYKSAHNASKV